MDFLQLSYFVEVAEQLSFTKAAQKLNISQPALSRQISGLEKEFGIKLFARSATGITITEEGSLALDRARDLLYHYHSLEDTLAGIGSRGKQSLSLGCSLLLSSILGSNIYTSYLYVPDHAIRCYDGTTRSLILMIARALMDFGVGIRYDSMLYDNMNEIDLTPFHRGSLCAVIRRDALPDAGSFADLSPEQTIVSSLEFESFLNHCEHAFDSIIYTDNLHMMRTEILDNDCIGLVPDIALPFFGDEVRLLALPDGEYYECCFIKRRGAKLSRNLLDFEEVITQAARAMSPANHEK